MAFTASDVKALREKTGVGMMDCKKALVESDGDMDKAIDFLREKGLAAATKKASRIAAEGVVMAYTDEAKQTSVIIEVNSETDFVAYDTRHSNRVHNIGFARTAFDSFVRLIGKVESLRNDFNTFAMFCSEIIIQQFVERLIDHLFISYFFGGQIIHNCYPFTCLLLQK